MILLRRFDVARLQADLAVIDANSFLSHGHVGWKVVPLRSRGGRSDEVQPADVGAPFRDTPILKKTPYFREVIAALEPVGSVRLSSIEPGGEIKSHEDTGILIDKIHVSIVTNPGCKMIFRHEEFHWAEGEAWRANFKIPHAAVNRGLTRRVHMLICPGGD